MEIVKTFGYMLIIIGFALSQLIIYKQKKETESLKETNQYFIDSVRKNPSEMSITVDGKTLTLVPKE